MGTLTVVVERLQSDAQQWPGRKLIGTREVLLQVLFEGAKIPGFSNGKGNRIPYFWFNIPD